MEDLQAQFAQAGSAAEQYKQDSNTLSAQIQRSTKDLERCKTEGKVAKDQLGQLATQSEQLREAVEQLQAERDRYAAEIKTLREQLKAPSPKITRPQQPPQQTTVQPSEEKQPRPLTECSKYPRQGGQPLETGPAKQPHNLF